jgi:hypothetical protein
MGNPLFTIIMILETRQIIVGVEDLLVIESQMQFW